MRLQHIKKYVVTLILYAFVTTAQAASDLVKDMVHLDQVYIPLLAYTSAEDAKASRTGIADFDTVWRDFKSKYYSKPGNDALWKSDIVAIDKYVQASKKIILSGTNIYAAHEELEHVRVVFMRLRERNGIEYYVDHLTRFHEPMEKMVFAVKGKTVATLTDNELSLIQRTLPDARQLWQRVSNSKFDAALYEFNKSKAAMLKTLVHNEQVALAKLQKAIEAKDKARIIRAGLAIKPNFVKLFKAFGDFPKKNK